MWHCVVPGTGEGQTRRLSASTGQLDSLEAARRDGQAFCASAGKATSVMGIGPLALGRRKPARPRKIDASRTLQLAPPLGSHVVAPLGSPSGLFLALSPSLALSHRSLTSTSARIMHRHRTTLHPHPLVGSSYSNIHCHSLVPFPFPIDAASRSLPPNLPQLSQTLCRPLAEAGCVT